MDGPDRQDLGDNHEIIWSSYEGQKRVGANVKHLTSAGEVCNGFIAIKGRSWEQSFQPGTIQSWDMVQEEPVSLQPSILCRGCGDHGYITNGRWVKA